MILFYKGTTRLYVVGVSTQLPEEDLQKLSWLFGNAKQIKSNRLEGYFIGPRKEMITPWSTNAVEITQNMGVNGILRIEEFEEVEKADATYDSMLQALYNTIDQEVFSIEKTPDPILYIDDIAAYNQQEGLALSADEIEYLEGVSRKIDRKLTDSEVFGFSQVNSEHCRHKIFNGTFIIDGQEKQQSLFALIKQTSKEHPNKLISAYKDNVAFVLGPKVEQFAPETQDKADFFSVKEMDTVISLKAETHNFPTTVEPFNGAATGTGGEIRDRLAGGKASLPLAGTAVYMTSYPRTEEARAWEEQTEARPWLYQTPEEILVKASNGASDFGNKFGQPLICGSVLTFEHEENNKKFGYDKVIMQAGGVGYGRKEDSLKDTPQPGDVIVVLGGDNYRIGMGGGAVSSVATGEFANAIELNAVQRSNPEMQKRVANAIRAMAESGLNPIVSIHDHGAGGHLNSLSELVEETGGVIDLHKLPVGDPTLSAKEIIGNESQERMGLVIKEEDVKTLHRVADRERAPMYEVGKTTGDMNFRFEDTKTQKDPINLKLADMFGKPPKTIIRDTQVKANFQELDYDVARVTDYLEQVLQLEAVACKDWLTNKVDRSVTGRIARQQCAGPLQLPLNDVAVVAMDFQGQKGVATAIGHAPISAMIDPAAGSRLSIAEALTNLVWAPIEQNLKGVSLSANWMWPCKNPGEDARLYQAVEAVSEFACALGINIPTGKDSLSMTQKYPNGDVVYSPGTVIISSAGEVTDIRKTVDPVLKAELDSSLYYIDFSNDEFHLGGSSFSQVLNKIGQKAPTVKDTKAFANAFNAVQELVEKKLILAGHDVSAGGLITALLEMLFAVNDLGMDLALEGLGEKDVVRALFSEKPAVLIQVKDQQAVENVLEQAGVRFVKLGRPISERKLSASLGDQNFDFDIDSFRDLWFKTSYLLDRKQSGSELALERFGNYKKLELEYQFGEQFTGQPDQYGIAMNRRERSGCHAAIIREKGVNGDREMAYSLYLAGFDVKDVHMTDLVSGRETLDDIHVIVFVGGFSNSDVLGSAKGWAGAFRYNEKARLALEKFYKRNDTLSLGICNGCQLMVELGLVNHQGDEQLPKMKHNESGKFESGFINVDIMENDSVMLKSLAGTRLGVWIAHGEGKFELPYEASHYQIPVKYTHSGYPANPNGSDYDTAAICSADGRHLAMMPHLERSIFPWQWAYYPTGREQDLVSPWVEAFANALSWVKAKRNQK